MSLFEEFCFGKPLKKTHKRNQSVICVERDLIADIDKVNKPDDNSAPPVPRTYVDTPDCYYELTSKFMDNGDFVWTCESDLYEACERAHVDDTKSTSPEPCDREHLDEHSCKSLDPLDPMTLLGLVIAYGGMDDYVAYPNSSDLLGNLCLFKGVLSWQEKGSDWVTIRKGLDVNISRYLYFE